ncbi:hypothetical protein KY329_03635 [Candidatus Woesearchaeota archaeon]|nr:hypothetical protein [Candidatus Woesearchaeota archaeon]
MNIKAVVLLMVVLAACAAEQQAEPLTCNAPYFEYKSGECCLDANSNRVCDADEVMPVEQEIQVISPEPTIMQQFLEDAPTKYAFHNFKTGLVLVVGDKRRAIMEPVETGSTSIYWDLAEQRAWTVCDSDVEYAILGRRYDAEVARCTPGQVDVRELNRNEYLESLDIADGPIDWMLRYKDREPTTVDTQMQQINYRSITPIVYYDEPDGSMTIIKFDKYYKVPVRIERVKRSNGEVDKTVVNYEFHKNEVEGYPLTEATVTAPQPKFQEAGTYELELTHIYPTDMHTVRVRGYIKNLAEIKTGNTRLKIECYNKYGDVKGSDYVFIGSISPGRTQSFETDIEMNAEDLEDCYAEPEDYVWSWN